MLFLPKSIIKFFNWWLVKAPKWIFTFFYRLTQYVNSTFSFTLNIRLFFTPLYGDYTIIGRLIGIMLRTVFIVFGSVFVVFLLVCAIIAPVVWYLIPITAIYFLGFWIIPIVLATYLLYIYKNLNVPEYRIREIENKENIDISKTFRPQTLAFLEKIEKKSTYDLNRFLNIPTINYIIKKAELDLTDFKEKLVKNNTIVTENIKNNAYNFAKEENTRYVENEHLFLGYVNSIPKVDTFLAQYSIKFETIERTVDWVVQQREALAKAFFWQTDYEMPKMSGFGHGLTGRVTPELDAISQDFTKMVKFNRFGNILGRDKEIEKIANLLGSSRQNVLLVGEPGCGKTSIVMGLAQRIMHGTDYKTLQNKRIVSLEMGGLIAGAKSSGQIADKLKRAMNDAIGSGDIIMFIDEIHTMVGSLEQDESFSTVYSILEPYLAANKIQFIAATTLENYRKYIEPSGNFARLFEIIDIPESNRVDTIKILQERALKYEPKFNVIITMRALIKIVDLSEKLIHDRVLPDKALDILNRACARASSGNGWVTEKIVEEEISEMTHIPVTAVSEEESEKLLRIDEEMKKRVIGQDHAIKKIASALKRARVGIRDESKPIASFLFVGTTGVGKTETAKTLSNTYFGSAESMIRLDMSEYQTADSIDKLIGKSDGSSKGVLTEAVRSKPFTVVLLDEIEKAHHQIILTFLQVLDDARLTDPTGKTVDFTNTIIIATSNAGTKSIQEISERGGEFEEIEKSAENAVRNSFAPEFLNRFTAIVVFKPLAIDNVKQIARILLRNVQNRTEDKNIKIEFTEPLIDELVKKGFNPEWGARPLARVIEDTVETYIAEKILEKKFKAGDEIKLGLEVFEKVE